MAKIQEFELNQEVLGRLKRYVDVCMFRLNRCERFMKEELGVVGVKDVNQLHIKKYTQER